MCVLILFKCFASTIITLLNNCTIISKRNDMQLRVHWFVLRYGHKEMCKCGVIHIHKMHAVFGAK